MTTALVDSVDSLAPLASLPPGASGHDLADVWRKFFQHWPKGLSHAGVLVTEQEQIPFAGFMHTDAMLLIERRTPDTQGARKVLVPYGTIVALKIVDVVTDKPFREAGFQGTLPGR
ncbi:MAG: hypothetical protein HYS13_22350 [Planctomycetia bacterium]|nr:hypothetical protein [Planctomycetia bacterium]